MKKSNQSRKQGKHKAVNPQRSDEHYMVRTRPKCPIYMGPPTYKQQVIRSWKIRFDVAANAASQQLSSNNLGALLGVFATAATTSVYLTPTFRLRAVHMWSWTATIGTTVDISLKLTDSGTAGGQGGPPCTVADSSASINKPAYCGIVLPEDSIFARWQQANSTNPFLVYYSPQQAVMDLIFEFIIDDLGLLIAGPTLAGATLGTIYHKSAATLTVVQPLNGL